MESSAGSVTYDTSKVNNSGIYVARAGNIATVTFNNLVPKVAMSSDTTIATLVNIAPRHQVFGVIKDNSNNDVLVFITTAGNIRIAGVTGVATNKNLYGSITFVTSN